MTKFLKSNATGKVGEGIVANLLQSAGLFCIYNEDKKTRLDYDLSCSLKTQVSKKNFTIEVKYDVFSARSGNLAIEVRNNKQGKPSGLTATKADLWTFVLPSDDGTEVWMTKTNVLREFVDSNTPYRHITHAGDNNAELMLYRKDDMLDRVFIRFDQLKPANVHTFIEAMLI